MAKKRIYLGADHGGFDLKEDIKEFLQHQGCIVIDLGNEDYDKDDNYPFFAQKVANETVKTGQLGILVCTTGVGMDMAANKVKGARSVLAHNSDIALMASEHEGANILCLGAKYTSLSQAKKIIKAWLSKEFSRAKRHRNRVAMLKSIENDIWVKT